MVKKKKKLSYSEQQKQLQLQQTQNRNMFKQKMLEVCIAIGDAKLLNLIPPDEMRSLYMVRAAPLKVKAEKGARIQKRLIEVIETYIKKDIALKQIEMIPGSGRTITLTDYFVAGVALEKSLHSEQSHIKEKERFAEFMKHFDARREQYFDTVNTVCNNTCTLYNDAAAHKGLYTYRLDIEQKHEEMMDNLDKAGRSIHLHLLQNLDVRMHATISIYTLPLDLKQVHVDGEPRTAIRLGTVHAPTGYVPRISYVHIKSSMLGANHAFAEEELPVYAQQHALNRLIERTGCTIPSVAYMFLCVAVVQPIITRLPNNKFLLAYSLNDLKVGYLLCERIGNFILIRTFLFLTNSHTPEGDKLAALTKLQKEDMIYLTIDNLKSLLSSDVMENESLRRIFREAGCQSLLDLYKETKTNSFVCTLLGIPQEKTALSGIIMEYLNPQADNDEYVIGE